MNKGLNLILFFLGLFVITNCTNPQLSSGDDADVTIDNDGSGDPPGDEIMIDPDSTSLIKWAKSTISTDGKISIAAVALSDSGNLYAAGNLDFTVGETVNFGNGITYTKPDSSVVSSRYQGFVVKYSPDGHALFLTVPVAPDRPLEFTDIEIDASENIYVVGYIDNPETINFGNGVTLSATGSADSKAIIVKYNSSGNAQWANYSNGADIFYTENDLRYRSISISSDGTIVAVAEQNTLTYPSIVDKYDPDTGNLQLHKSFDDSVHTGAEKATIDFIDVITDSSGKIHIIGDIIYSGANATSTISFGLDPESNPVEVTPTFVKNTYGNGIVPFLLTLNSNGLPLRVNIMENNQSELYLKDMAVNGINEIFISGFQRLQSTTDFGNGITLANPQSGTSAFLIKYGADGTPISGFIEGSANSSGFSSIACDDDGSLYAVGSQSTNATYNYGGLVGGSSYLTDSNSDAVLLKFDSSLAGQWMETVWKSTMQTSFRNIGISSYGIAVGGSTYYAGEASIGGKAVVESDYSGSNGLVGLYLKN